MRTEVVIVGGGPVGLALAMELGTWGVDCVLVERRVRPSRQPRAKLINVRSMELMRRWGVADQIRAEAPLPPDFPSDVVFATRLDGRELVRFPDALNTARRRDAPSPEPAQQVPQSVVEGVLRARLERMPSVVRRFETELADFEQDDASVTAALRGRAGDQTVRARWMVACDGARSGLRDALGIAMDGGADLARNLGVVFRAASLWREMSMGPAMHYWLVNNDIPSIVGPLDQTETWWFQATAIAPDVDPRNVDARAMVRRAIGRDTDCELMAVDPWSVNCQLAERYRLGRVFLAGDAAHLHPPMGGYGMNMGIGDAVDLGWKLAAVCQGWGDEALLESYELERRPIHRRVVEEAASNYSVLSNDIATPLIEADGPEGDAERRAAAERIRTQKAKEFRSIGIQLGYRYEDSPIVEPDGSAPTADTIGDYIPTARPGHRAPHVWLSEDRSIHDAFGPWFTLLRFDEGVSAPRLQRAAARARLPLRVQAVRTPAARDLYGAGLVLVRPDMHVAWRGDADPNDPGGLIARVAGAAAVNRETMLAMGG